ncbi:hypothetical protein THARTR1_04539 [Trichoderma harzianum]|uniref:Uncharacterized protein n=1 Tax=Trichoderma harzianum TaxID=5544 RepID=A0A2K0UAQ3_TRIHA|nr:hypothetical protein THARTR1_04539 [Trichoderma harzianum]
MIDCQKQQDSWFWNYPVADDVKVVKLKDAIGELYDKSKDLLNRLKIMRSTGNYDDYTQWSDLVDAAALLPSLSMQMVVENMQAVVKEADEIKKAECEEMILNFIIGDAAGAVGMIFVRSALDLLDTIRNAGLLK